MTATPSPGRCSSKEKNNREIPHGSFSYITIFGSRSDAAYFYAILEVVSMRKLKKYKPTRFMAKDLAL